MGFSVCQVVRLPAFKLSEKLGLFWAYLIMSLIEVSFHSIWYFVKLVLVLTVNRAKHEWPVEQIRWNLIRDILYFSIKTCEPPHDKKNNNKMTCVPSEDSDQPGHPPSLIRIFALCMKKPWVLSYPTQWMHSDDWSDWTEPSLCCGAQAFCWFVMRWLKLLQSSSNIHLICFSE